MKQNTNTTRMAHASFANTSAQTQAHIHTFLLALPPSLPLCLSLSHCVCVCVCVCADLSGTTPILPTFWVFAGWRPCCLIFAN